MSRANKSTASTRMAFLFCLIVTTLTHQAQAQCTLIIQDTFRLGLRPHGGSGQPRNINLSESLAGYWPLIPAHVQWSTLNISGQPTWAWAATSIDPMETDALDPSNGTAFTAASDVTALLPFSPPSGSIPFSYSIDVVPGSGQTNPMFVGFTSSSATSDNFLASGTLWISYDGTGAWSVQAPGQTLASGAGVFGQFNSGWVRLELTYDPLAHIASGNIGYDSFGPVSVTIPASQFTFAGFEAHGGFFNVVNNFLVRSGPAVTATVIGPASACAGGQAGFTALTNADAPSVIFWLHDRQLITDGPGAFGIVSGANTTNLTIASLNPLMAGSIQCAVSNPCGTTVSLPVSFAISSSGSGDGDANGVVDGADIPAFVALLTSSGSTDCTYDMNGDGSVTTADIAPFVARLLAN